MYWRARWRRAAGRNCCWNHSPSARRPAIPFYSSAERKPLARRVAEWSFLGFVATLPVFQPFHLSFHGRQIFVHELLFALASATLVIAVARREVIVRLNVFHAAI